MNSTLNTASDPVHLPKADVTPPAWAVEKPGDVLPTGVEAAAEVGKTNYFYIKLNATEYLTVSEQVGFEWCSVTSNVALAGRFNWDGERIHVNWKNPPGPRTWFLGVTAGDGRVGAYAWASGEPDTWVLDGASGHLYVTNRFWNGPSNPLSLWDSDGAIYCNHGGDYAACVVKVEPV